jgi:hypothetical protein
MGPDTKGSGLIIWEGKNTVKLHETGNIRPRSQRRFDKTKFNAAQR